MTKNPAKPALIKTITDLGGKSGYLGPHTFYAMPGRLLIEALSNTKDKGGVTGMAMYNNKGDFIAKYDMPTADGGDGYGYDIAINPSRNALLTASFIGNNNYMRNLGDLIKDGEAMKKFGNTMVLWDLKAMKPKQVLTVPGALLEIRWSLKPGDNWAITATALTSKLWLVKQDRKKRAIPARLRLGRQGTQTDLRGGFHQGEAGPRAPHKIRHRVAQVRLRHGREPRAGAALSSFHLATPVCYSERSEESAFFFFDEQQILRRMRLRMTAGQRKPSEK